MVNKGKKKSYNGRISGIGPDNNPLSIDFEHTLDDFLDYDYEQIDTFDVDDLFKLELIQQMRESLEEHEIFEPDDE